ncbi:K319L-like protein [Mya arenaria]|uniref:K319L-like protein n=1 Tax=Mya arenaria TaxID=6604 RepID=A0ABY7EIG3_MYAAR|nr:K319L-like protein [Mya arenaria]
MYDIIWNVDPNKCSLGNSDLVIILDASTSVTQQNYDKMLQFTKDLLQNADIDSGAVRVGILIFSTEVQVMFNLNEYSRKADVFAAIDKIPYIFGSTNTANALQTMHTQMFTPRNGDRPNVPNTGINFDELVGLDRKIFSALCPEKAVTVPVTTPKPKPSCGVSSVDVVIIIDASTSVTEANFKLMLEFCKDIVKGADIDSGSVRVGVLIYSTEVEIQFHLNRYSTNAQVIDAIDKIPYIYGSTNTADALLTMHQTMFTSANGDRQGVTNVAIVLTDGMASEPKDKYLYNVRRFEELQGLEEDIFGAGEGGDCGVISVSTEVSIKFDLDTYNSKREVFDAIDDIPYVPGRRNTADGLKLVQRMFNTTERGVISITENVIMLLTVGNSDINSKETLTQAKRAKDKGIVIYAFGVGLEESSELEGIASTPVEEHLFSLQRFDQLDDIVENGYLTECEAIMNVRKETECGLSKVDAVIILDASTSVTEPNFKKMLNFCKEIVDKAAIDSGSVRIGVLIYSTEVEIEFHLNNYTNTADIKAAIDRIPYMYGTTNTADALKTMHELMFSARNGDRPDVDNIAFLITDGISNINGRRTIPEAEKAQGKAIRVYAIGIDLTDTRELEGIASEPKSGNMFNVKAFDELTGLIDTIFGGAEECAFSEPPIAVAGPDVTRRYPSGTITLDGRRSSDDNKIVTYTWSRDGRDLFTGATFDLNDLREGEYEYNLTVVDEDRQSDSDTVRVVIEAQDFPPNANAGDDVTIQLPVNSVRLDGRQSSDDVAVVQYMWKLTNGPPGVSLDGDDSATLVVDDLEEGEYTLTLTVTDALGQTDDDTVNVYVKAQDFPPTANAGVDVTIQLPVDYVILDGRNSSDDITIVQYMWKLTNGQPGVSLEGDDSARLMVEDLEEGEYTFTLTVTDVLGQTDDDTVNVFVKGATLLYMSFKFLASCLHFILICMVFFS